MGIAYVVGCSLNQGENKMNTQDWEVKQAARKSAASILASNHPYLVPAGNSLTTAAKNVRIELKRAFPDVKFSVRTSRFTGGDDLRVEWTDGPNTKQVDAITKKYAAGSFDGMTDCYDYSSSAWTDAFGWCLSLSCNVQECQNDKIAGMQCSSHIRPATAYHHDAIWK